MAVGRPKKPAELKKLQGTERNDRKLKNSFQPSRPASPPDPPANMGKEEAEIWAGLVDELHNAGILRVTDYPMMVQLVRNVRMMDMAYEQIKDGVLVDDGRGKKKNPAATIYSQAFQNFNTIAGQMGLSPATRQKISTPPKDNKEDGGMRLIGKL